MTDDTMRDLKTELTNAGILGKRRIVNETPALVLEALGLIAKDHGTTVKAIRGKNRHAGLARARRDAYAALWYLGLNRCQIGRVMGRDHSTVLWGIRKREAELTNAFYRTHRARMLTREGAGI